MGILVIVKDWGVFQDKKTNRMELSADKTLEANLVQSAFDQTLGEGSRVAQQSNALHLSARGITTDPGSIPGFITTGRDWESHRAAHNWPSKVRVWVGHQCKYEWCS